MAAEARRRPELWELGGRKDGYCGREGSPGCDGSDGSDGDMERGQSLFYFKMSQAEEPTVKLKALREGWGRSLAGLPEFAV